MRDTPRFSPLLVLRVQSIFSRRETRVLCGACCWLVRGGPVPPTRFSSPTHVRRVASNMGGPDGGQYEGYQNESETTTLLSPSPPSSPSKRGDSSSVKPTASTAHDDVRKHYKYALGTGYMFAMGVCGIVLVALGSTLDDLAENSETTATDVSLRVLLLLLCAVLDFRHVV